jgi:hypothetical protein
MADIFASVPPARVVNGVSAGGMGPAVAGMDAFLYATLERSYPICVRASGGEDHWLPYASDGLDLDVDGERADHDLRWFFSAA